jgi:hypothetical protein
LNVINDVRFEEENESPFVGMLKVESAGHLRT